MEQFSNAATGAGPIDKSSETPENSSQASTLQRHRSQSEDLTSHRNTPVFDISAEKISAMVGVLNKRWLTMGWHAMDEDDAVIMAIAFIEDLDRHKIPYKHYRGLLNRAIDIRASRFAQGMKCDDFSSDLLIAAWSGLEREIREREVREGRTLPETAASQCERCFGLGLENIYDEQGDHLGSRKGCQHKPVEQGEGLWIKQERDRAAAAVLGDVEPTIDTAIAAIGSFKVESADSIFRRLCIDIRRASLHAPESPVEAHEWHTNRPDPECEHCLVAAWLTLNRAWDYVKKIEG